MTGAAGNEGHSLLEIIVAASSKQQTADQRYQQTIFHFHNAVYLEDYGQYDTYAKNSSFGSTSISIPFI